MIGDKKHDEQSLHELMMETYLLTDGAEDPIFDCIQCGRPIDISADMVECRNIRCITRSNKAFKPREDANDRETIRLPAPSSDSAKPRIRVKAGSVPITKVETIDRPESGLTGRLLRGAESRANRRASA